MQTYKTIEDFGKILALFKGFQVEERGVTEISNALEMTASKVSRMLRTLENERFFERNLDTGKYRLGFAFFELGMAYAFHFPLRKIIRPHIEHIAKGLGLTASWGIFQNDNVIVVDRIQNLNIDLMSYRIGLNLPIHSTSIGKILLAYFPEEKQDRVIKSIKLNKFTEKTIVDPISIKEKLKIYRELGYATDEGETHEELNCIAVPIKNQKGEVIAAVNLMAEQSQASAEELFKHSAYLKERAMFISRQLGYTLFES
ncbi:MAG: IclR family transcriptional regulator [Deltaproteobacteria bacterium]|nr:IclR family transcriptional regulator [Deltaproteobacteria bacterium]MBW2333511.1 IclR family transcriptional regulator [Deltaproteobacteria bacterium]